MKCNLVCDNKSSTGYCKNTGMCSKYFNKYYNIIYDSKIYTGMCSSCKYNDGVIYTSDPPKYRCTITNEYHLGGFICNCREIVDKIDSINYDNINIINTKESNMKRIKLYKVDFLRYTNVMKDTVSNIKDDYKVTGNEKYLDARDLIVREQDLEYYRQFGGGLKSIEFVGYLGEPEVQ